MVRLQVRGLCVLFLLFILASGCATVSTTGMIESDSAPKNFRVDDVKFSLVMNDSNITEEARRHYPDLFNNEFTSLPLYLKINIVPMIR